jgi:hypothetical protein
MKSEMLLTKNLVTQLRAIVKHSIKIDEQNHEMDFKNLWSQMKEVLAWYINGNTYHVRTNYTQNGHDLHIHLLNAGWEPEVVVKTVYKKVKDSDTRQRKDLRWVVNAETEAEKTIIMLFHCESKTSASEFVKNYFVGLLSNVSQIVQADKIEPSIINEDPVDEKELITMAIMKDIEKYNSWFLFKNQVWKKI